MTIEEYFGGWTKVIDKTELNHVLSVLSKEYLSKSVCPNQTDVFKAFKLCPFENLKIVFLGQNPYPQKGVATGILFGNKKEVLEEDLSPSLKIIKEAIINFEIPHNNVIFDQTLENWAKQGILMINSALTVEMNKIGSHVMLWRPFISKLLKNLSESLCSIVYVLFGKQAETFNPYINKKFNHVLKIEHPAYFARNRIKMPHYLFTEIDKKLNDIYGYSIKWYEEY